MILTVPPQTGSPDLDTWLEHLHALLIMNTGELRLGDDESGTYVSITPAGNLAAVAGTLSGLLTTQAGRIANTTRITDSDSPYTVLATDEIIYADTDGGAIEADLPAGVEGTHYKFYNVGSSGNDLSIDPDGTETISGGAAGVVATVTDGNSLDIYYNATEGWY